MPVLLPDLRNTYPSVGQVRADLEGETRFVARYAEGDSSGIPVLYARNLRFPCRLEVSYDRKWGFPANKDRIPLSKQA
jgi:hypothetical protein